MDSRVEDEIDGEQQFENTLGESIVAVGHPYATPDHGVLCVAKESVYCRLVDVTQ
jgi:hypothetical protein